jgi:hypothetical protein
MGMRIDVAALNPVIGLLSGHRFDDPCRARERTPSVMQG